MELNKIHNIDFLENTLPDKCANLIIADPPYFEVKGDFDFIWETFDDYLKDVEKWAIECKRLLADNGTLLWYGDAKNIAYSQVIFDKYFNLLNSLVWENTNDHKQQIRFNTGLRTFAPCTERILMYSKEDNFDDYDRVIYGLKDYTQYMCDVKFKCNINAKELNTYFGYVAGCSWWFNKKQPRFINETDYKKLQEKFPLFNRSYNDLLIEYKVNLAEYEELRRPFNNEHFYGDVIRMPNYETSKYDHDTVKPEKLTRILITTCSRPNDLVVVPFAGSGTECAMAVKEGRKTIGFEITEKHAKMSNERVQNILRQPSLFVGS